MSSDVTEARKHFLMGRILPLMLCAVGLLLAGTMLANRAGISGASLGVCGGPDSPCASSMTNRWSVFPAASSDAAVASSRGIPVALLGVWYFIFMASWFAFVGQPGARRRNIHFIPSFMAIAGCCAAGWFVAVMFATRDLCPLCLMVHLTTAALALVVFSQRPVLDDSDNKSSKQKPGASRDESSHPSPSLLGSVFTLAIVASLAAWQAYASVNLRAVNSALARQGQQSPAAVIPAGAVTDDDALPGSRADAPMTLVMFDDMQCGPCAEFERQLLSDILPQFDGYLRVIVKHYPLCTDCNSNITSNLHPAACQSAYLAEAVRLQAGTRAMLSARPMLASSDGKYSPAQLALIASSLGLNVQKLQSDMQSALVHDRVRADIDLGKSLGVNGTPSLYLDGKTIEYAQRSQPSFWRSMAEAARGRSKAPIATVAVNVPVTPVFKYEKGLVLNISGPSLRGGTIDLKSYRGKPVLVEFWASWCHFCQDEMPGVSRIYQTYHPDGLEIVGVSLDNTRVELQKYVDTNQLPWPQIYFDEEGKRGWQNRAAVQWGVNSVPTMILLDRDGRVVQSDLRGPAIEVAVAQILGKPVPASVAAAATQPAAAPAITGFAAGDLPAVAGPGLTGETIDLQQYRGKPVLVEFWASWCHFCQGEMPGVLHVYQQYHPAGLQIVGISLDEKKDDLAKYIQTQQMPWPQIFFDQDGSRSWNNPLVKKFGVNSIPFIALLDANGKVIASDLRGPALDAAVAAAFAPTPATQPSAAQTSAR